MQSTHDILTFNQETRETSMVSAGRLRATERDRKAAAGLDQTRAERLTIAHLIPDARDFLLGLLAHYEAAEGKRPDWHATLKGLDIDELAAAAVRAGFAAGLKRLPLPRALALAGQHVEIIWGHSALRVRAKTYVARQRVRALTKARATPEARRRAVARAVAVVDLEDQDGCPERGETGWSEETLIRMGEPLVSAAIATGLFEVTASRKSAKDTTGRRDLVLALSEKGQALTAEVEDMGLLTRPIYRPMLSPPKPWETLKGGAYLTDAVRDHLSFVRGAKATHRAILSRSVREGSLQPVMDVVSAIQGVPLAIDTAVLELRQWAMAEGLELPDVLPLRKAVVVPVVPADLSGLSQGSQRRLFAQRARSSRVNSGIGPNLAAFNSITKEAEELAGAGVPFYQPHSLDFRGRVYPIAFFSHQGGDASRSLVRFHNGKALGEGGLFWLKVHAANCGDFKDTTGAKVSKLAFWAREAWADAHLEDIIRPVALSPRVNRQWMDADAPFSFYAACRELVHALDSGNPEGFVSTLPIALDGSNSGVQHYSSLMRAAEGRYVNLTPTDAPQDLYGEVAVQAEARAKKVAGLVRSVLGVRGQAFPSRDEVIGFLDILHEALETLESPEPSTGAKPCLDATQKRMVHRMKLRRSTLCALLWAEEGITRSTVKRNVMTFGYSSQAYGMSEQIRTDYMEPLALRVMRGELPSHPFGADEGKAAAGWLGKTVYRSVCGVLPKVSEAMRWLRDVAAVTAHEQKGILLVTPMGFPMLMRETESPEKRIELRLLDRSVTPVEATPKHDLVVSGTESVLARVRCHLRVREETTVIKTAQQNGVAPNVIHAMDAAHLMLTVQRMVGLGIPDLLLIHDSFATHAGNVSTLSVVLREQLGALYADYCPLADIHARALKVLSPEGAAKLPPLPEKGPLDLWEGLLEATYAFS